MAPKIKTKRLTLRAARWDDLDALHNILSRPDATRYWSTPAHTDMEESRNWLDAMINNPLETGCDFVVELDGRVIGKAGMWHAPEIGYILHPDYWGRGLATEAVTAVVQTIFASTETDPITAEVDPRNTASLALLKRLGFAVTRTKDKTAQDDGDDDSIYLTLSRASFLNAG